MKVGIIRCLARSNQCSANHCLRAINNKPRTGEFARYDDTFELVGIDTCGGCWHGTSKEILNKAKILKERGGAEIVHLSTCMMLWCPWKEKHKAALVDMGLTVVEWTHELAPGPRPPDDW